MHRVDGVSAREISRRTGLHRNTVERLLAAPVPPRYQRRPAGSKLDPFKDWICEQLAADPRIQSQRLREMATEIGYEGGKSIFDDFVREVRPRFLVARTFQRTIYRPGELVQCDLWEPTEHVPVGHGQRRRGWVVTCEVCWSRAIAGTLIFSKEAPDILWGLARNLGRLGVLPEKLVWDRESAIAAGGRPTEAFAAFCGQLEVGWVILEPRDPQAKRLAGAFAPVHALELRAGPSVREPPRLPGPPRRLDRQGEPAPASDDPGDPGRAAGRGEDADAPVARQVARTSTAARFCGCRRSRSSGSTATTTRSTPRSPGAASRSGSPRPRSPRSCSTPASSPAATGVCLPAG